MQSLQLFPVDTLFFRDARPMQAGAGSGGHGANWPLPTVLHEALRSELLRSAGVEVNGKPRLHRKRSSTSNERHRYVASDEFRSLRTIGPFPCDDRTIYFPLPQDIVDRGGDDIDFLNPQMVDQASTSNFPTDWLHLLISPVPPSKKRWSEWVSLEWYNQYLGKGSSLVAPPERHCLYDVEPRIGVAIDHETGAAIDGRLYASEHLRLRPGVSLWFQASLSQRDREHNPKGLAPESFCGQVFPLGGESRSVRMGAARRNYFDSLVKPDLDTCCIKWVLTTHAVFNNGWLPSWIDSRTGAVMLKSGDVERRPEEPRLEWRKRIREMQTIQAHLVAARVQKPIYFSGWDGQWTPGSEAAGAQNGGPKPSFLAVPAGSVYYFQADSIMDAQTLLDALWLRTRSDCFGEKGMGLGVCSTWQTAN